MPDTASRETKGTPPGTGPRPAILCAPAILLIFILPFTHTVALRLTTLAFTGIAALWIWQQRNGRDIAVPLKLPIALWALAAVASLAYTINLEYTLKELKNEIAYPLIAFLSFFALTRGRKELVLFLSALTVSSLIMVTLAIGAFIHFGHWHTEGYQGGVGSFSTYIVMVLPYLLFYAVLIERPLARALTLLLIPAALSAAYFTLNRAFWPAFVIEMLVLAGLMGRRLRLFQNKQILAAGLMAASVLSLAALAAFLAVVNQRFAGQADFGNLADILAGNIRLPFWASILDVLRDHTLLGTGFGRHTFAEAHPELRGNQNLWHAHNVFLNYWMQTGLPGLLALILLFGAILREFWHMYRYSTQSHIACLGACGMAMMAGFVTKNLTDDFFVRDISLLFWSLTGITLGYGMRHMKKNEDEEHAQPPETRNGSSCFSKHGLKVWLRSGSWRFLADSRPGAFGREVHAYRWNGHPVYYRPGSSDIDLIYKILLKRGRKGEYWVPGHIAPRVILDIGGNIGIASIYFARRFPRADIFTFEPVAENYALLRKNTEPYPRIRAFQVALGGRDGHFRISASDNRRNYGGYSFHYSGKEKVHTTTSEVRDAAAFLRANAISKIDLIKIDTEGHENEILRALEQDMLARVTWIIGELHSSQGFDLLGYLSRWFDIEVRKSFGKPLFMFNARNRRLLDKPA